MITVKCTKVFRDKRNNKIFGYRIVAADGQEKDIRPEVLKDLINSKTLEVSNLTLTSDNRIIKHNEKVDDNTTEKEDILSKCKKLQIMGYKVSFVVTPSGSKVVIAMSDGQNILIIPSYVTAVLKPKSLMKVFPDKYQELMNSEKTLKVIGGHGLISGQSLFYRCKAESFDFSEFNTSNMIDTSNMFAECEAEEIDISNWNTYNVENTCRMFYYAKCKVLKISRFSNKLRNIRKMFMGLYIERINLEDIDATNIENISETFAGINTNLIDISSWNLEKLKNAVEVFRHTIANEIRLPKIKTYAFEEAYGTIYAAKIGKINTVGSGIKRLDGIDRADIGSLMTDSDVILSMYLIGQYRQSLKECHKPIIVEYTDVSRVGNEVLAYRLKDAQGNEREIAKEDIIYAIASRKLLVKGLTLTETGKLKTSSQSSIEQLNNIINSNIELENLIQNDIDSGLPVIDLKCGWTYCTVVCDFINSRYKLYIPNNITHCDIISTDELSKVIYKIVGNYVVIGGEGLDSKTRENIINIGNIKDRQSVLEALTSNPN